MLSKKLLTSCSFGPLSPHLYNLKPIATLQTTKQYSRKRQRWTPLHQRKHMPIVSYRKQADWALGTRCPRSSLSRRPLKPTTQSVKTAMLSDIHTHLNRRNERTSCGQSQIPNMRYCRRVCNMSSTVEHETPRPEGFIGYHHQKNRSTCQKDLQVIHPATDGFREGLDYCTYWLADKSS